MKTIEVMDDEIKYWMNLAKEYQERVQSIIVEKNKVIDALLKNEELLINKMDAMEYKKNEEIEELTRKLDQSFKDLNHADDRILRQSNEIAFLKKYR